MSSDGTLASNPWIAVEALDNEAFARLRRRAIFDCCKWDPQVGDTCVIARHPLVITHAAWREVSTLAQALAAETLAAEAELTRRPALLRRLGIPRSVRRALRRVSSAGPARDAARLMRFDFHYTTEGWRISEVNADVPGGLNEASGFAPLMAPHYPSTTGVGDPVDAYVKALVAAVGPRATIGLVHATAYCDDQQMMTFVARRLEAAGVSVHLASPAHLRWRDGSAWLHATWWQGPLDGIVRFFPAEWLTGLPSETGWPLVFAGSRTPLSNPATAIVVQTKRFPLIWDALETRVPTWRALLAETRDPRDAPWRASDEWVVKPALGRMGEGVGVRSVVDPMEMRRIDRSVRWCPGAWVAQRRFHPLPIEIDGVPAFPCLGVYTLDGRVVGAYGRVARLPLIDGSAADAAVLAA